MNLRSLQVVLVTLFSLLVICLSLEDDVTWYASVGRDLLDLTSSNSFVANGLNSLIGQKNPFTAFDLFLNSTRRILPTVATFGNFTLLQAALVCATGAIAVGAATIAAEAFYFKIQNDQAQQHDNYQSHYVKQLPSIAYGSPQHKTGQYRRNYEEYTPNTGKTSDYFKDRASELERRYPPKSLKRTQRRNQRKNKNSADQLDRII